MAFLTGLLPLFVLAHFGHHLMMALLSPLLPFIRNDFSLSYTQVGGLLFSYNVSYGISQLPAGWAADRLGPRIMLTAGVAGVALAGLLIGLSPNYIVLALFLVILGLMGGGYHPAASPLVSASVKPENRGKALGIHQIGGTGSFFLAPLIAAGLASALGWRGAFLSISIPAIAFGILFYILLGRMGYTGAPKKKAAEISAAKPSEPGDLRRLSAFIAIGIASMVLVYSSLQFVPLYAVDILGASEEAGAMLLSVAYFGGIWGGPLGGYLSDRLGRIPVIIAVGLVAGPAIYLLNHVSLGFSLYAVLLLMGTAMHVGMPVVESYIISHVSPRKRSTVLGIYYTGSRGGPAITLLIGYLIDTYQFYITLSGIALTMLAVALVGTVLLWGKRG
ncbi:MAG TPA: MFS transporter [Dehalococcoidia bacterium]|nr:MFS transporter [Dehalococcoidia bacterium]